MECYQYITDTLSYLMSCCKTEVSNLTEQQAQQHVSTEYTQSMHTKKNNSRFLEIFKHLLWSFYKIGFKCFLGDACIVMYARLTTMHY